MENTIKDATINTIDAENRQSNVEGEDQGVDRQEVDTRPILLLGTNNDTMLDGIVNVLKKENFNINWDKVVVLDEYLMNICMNYSINKIMSSGKKDDLKPILNDKDEIKRATKQAIELYDLISKNAKKNDENWISIDRLSKRTNIQIKDINNGIAYLEMFGYVIKKQKNEQTYIKVIVHDKDQILYFEQQKERVKEQIENLNNWILEIDSTINQIINKANNE